MVRPFFASRQARWTGLTAAAAVDPPAATFECDLRTYDAMAFNTATLPRYAKDWR